MAQPELHRTWDLAEKKYNKENELKKGKKFMLMQQNC